MYWSLVNRMAGYLRDFDCVVVIDITDDDDWMAVMLLFHILLHQLMVPIIYSLFKIHTFKSALRSTYRTWDQ